MYVKSFSANGTFINYRCLNPEHLDSEPFAHTITSYVSSTFFFLIFGYEGGVDIISEDNIRRKLATHVV
jgi:hypothetical protein